MLSLLEFKNVAISLFFLLHNQVQCKDFQVFGRKGETTYGFTVISSDSKIIKNIIDEGILKAELLVLPNKIKKKEWNNKNKLINAQYFEDYKEFLARLT